MIPVKEALYQILEQIPQLGRERVGILEAQGRVLAEDIYSSRDIPPWDNSAMDGYAVRYSDIQTAARKIRFCSGSLRIFRPVRFSGVCRLGEAVRIMTGAPLPAGADTVVPVEETIKADGNVKILAPIQTGENIRCAGEDIRSGEKVLETELSCARRMLACLLLYAVPRLCLPAAPGGRSFHRRRTSGNR